MHRNTKFGHKLFTLHHCCKELCKNEKWIQRIAETIPKRSWISISVEDDNEVDEDAKIRLERNKNANERKKRNAFSGTYKDELAVVIKIKKVLAVECKEYKMAMWNELKAFENEKWKTKLMFEERKLKAVERRLALEGERIHGAKKAKERAIMFMNPNTV